MLSVHIGLLDIFLLPSLYPEANDTCIKNSQLIQFIIIFYSFYIHRLLLGVWSNHQKYISRHYNDFFTPVINSDDLVNNDNNKNITTTYMK